MGHSLHDSRGSDTQLKITVIIDVFRAATTAAYALSQSPSQYVLTNRTEVVRREIHPSSITIGKAEKGESFSYTIPNSPSRVQEYSLTDISVLHRSDAAGSGILQAGQADLILLAGFVNAKATSTLLKKYPNAELSFIPMGHLGTTPSEEDESCATYLQTGMLSIDREQLRQGPGRLFFSDDQKQYPEADFETCLEVDRFDFAIQAEVNGDYAILSRIDAP